MASRVRSRCWFVAVSAAVVLVGAVPVAQCAPRAARHLPTAFEPLTVQRALAGHLDREVLQFWTNPETLVFRPPYADTDGRQVIRELRLLYVHALALDRLEGEARRARIRAQYDAILDRLVERFRDTADGAWVTAASWDGLGVHDGRKQAVCQTYVVYVMAECARLLGDERALALAQEAFRTMDERAHDAQHGGYLERLDLPVNAPENARKQVGTNMHVALALARLLEVWPDETVRRRLAEVLDLLQAHVLVPGSGNCYMTFSRDWKPTSAGDNPKQQTLYGHSAELVWYAVEAGQALRRELREMLPWLQRVAEGVIGNGIGPDGRVYVWGPLSGPPEDPEFVSWWPQVEAMVMLARMYELTSEQRYWRLFERVTRFTFERFAPDHSGQWLGARRLDTGETYPYFGDAWHAGLHTARMLVECEAALRRIAPELPYQVYQLDPFAEVSVPELPASLDAPCERISLSAFGNDWAHQAFVITPGSFESVTVTLGLTGDARLLTRLRLRVVGFIKNKQHGYVMDPIFADPAAMGSEPDTYVRNLPNIRNFPTVTATLEDPVVVWVTADTRGLPPGRYQGAVIIEPSGGAQAKSIPAVLRVWSHELPRENPLITFGWQWQGSGEAVYDWARTFKDYGINVCHIDTDMAACQRAGYRFFLFVFSPSWTGKPPSEFTDEQILERLNAVKAKIAELHLKPEQWALYMVDEVSDDVAPNIAAWCERVRGLWPEARFFQNPSWGPGPTNTWSTVQGTVRPLLPWTDVWCPYSANLWSMPDGIQAMKDAGADVWFYEIMNSTYVRQPLVGRSMIRTLPWGAFAHGLSGIGWYSANAYSNTVSIWSDDCDGEYATFYWTVPGRGAEALREGIQEYKRLTDLRRLGAEQRVLDGFVERATHAQSVGDFRSLRRQMDRLLRKLTEPSQAG